MSPRASSGLLAAHWPANVTEPLTGVDRVLTRLPELQVNMLVHKEMNGAGREGETGKSGRGQGHHVQADLSLLIDLQVCKHTHRNTNQINRQKCRPLDRKADRYVQI